jgi:capsular exopolysaccharide synthesis family protein
VYGPNNRHLRDIQVQLDAIGGQISQELQGMVQRAYMDLQLAEQTENQIRQRFQAQQDEANRLNEKTVKLAVLSQEAYSRRKLYEDLYTKLQEANVSAGIKATNITIVDPARPESVPIRPRPMLNLELGVIFGIFLGLGTAYVVDSIDRTIVSVREVEELTGTQGIAAVPKFDPVQRLSRSIASSAKSPGGDEAATPNKDARMWILKHPHSAAAEAFRAIRTLVFLSRAGGGPKTILITSCVPGEGKSTVTANLAMTFAQHNKRVVIVEADMRRPTIKHVIDGPRLGLGLSNVLAGTASFDDAVQRGFHLEGLDVLSSGPRPPLPSELLGSAAFDELLEELRLRYDVVLFDSPPALIVTDAVAIAQKMDAVIWVVRAGLVTRPLLTRAVQMIHHARMPVIAFLLNGISLSSDPYGYAYEYGYGHKDYGAYYEENSKSE